MGRNKQCALAFEEEDGHAVILFSEDELIEKALDILAKRYMPGELLSSPERTEDFLRLRLAETPHETFGCVFLTNRHTVIAVEDIFTGTVDGAQVWSRVVVQKALGYNAAALICYHNHPSGNPEPSPSDETITRRLRETLALVDVRLLDHIVVGTSACVSFASRGLL